MRDFVSAANKFNFVLNVKHWLLFTTPILFCYLLVTGNFYVKTTIVGWILVA